MKQSDKCNRINKSATKQEHKTQEASKKAYWIRDSALGKPAWEMKSRIFG